MALYKYVNMDDEGLYDRVYRLHYNEGQQRTDKFAAAFGLLGALAAAAVVRPAAAVSVLGGAAVGMAAGVAAHVATAPPQAGKPPNKMLHELRTR